MNKKVIALMLIAFTTLNACKKDDKPTPNEGEQIAGYDLLTQIAGLWTGPLYTSTGLGSSDFHANDYRPISASHVHSITEGATGQNIIASFFIADFQGKKQMICRNGGYFAGVYRASYFVLDSTNKQGGASYYRFIDIIGGLKKNYLEVSFTGNKMRMKVFTDKGGYVPEPVLHMDFDATLQSRDGAQDAVDHFNFPQKVSEVDLNGKFANLSETATFLKEADDPFKESQHGYIARLKVNIARDNAIKDKDVFLILSNKPLIVGFDFSTANYNKTTTRFPYADGSEQMFEYTYMHPGTHYVTAIYDADNNGYPSKGDWMSTESVRVEVKPKQTATINIKVDYLVP